jgi:hypothetical protein
MISMVGRLAAPPQAQIARGALAGFSAKGRRTSARRRQRITPARARIGRKLLKWSKIDVAVCLDVGIRTIAAFERQERLP